MSAHRLPRVLAVWCALTWWAGTAAAAQSIFPVQNLAFGQLTKGVPLNVLPTDAARRAELDVTGSGTWVMSWMLPTHLRNAANNMLPITFSNTSGRLQWRTFGIAYNFDPKTPQTVWLPFFIGGATIYLGGTAQPSPTQAPGVYTATMTLVLANAGT